MQIPQITNITQLAQLKQAGERLFERKKIRETTHEVTLAARTLWERGWAERNAGNLSVDITRHVPSGELAKLGSYPFFPLSRTYPALARKVFLVTATGTRMRDVAATPEETLCFLYISENGSACHIITAAGDPGKLKPTSELATHLAIHQMLTTKDRPERAVLHTHATELIALTQIREMNSEEALNRIFFGMHPETVMFLPEGIGYIPYTLPGTETLAHATVRNFETHRVVLWEKHGCMAIGPTIMEALDNIDMVAKPARIWFMVKNAGGHPEGLTDEQIRELKEQA